MSIRVGIISAMEREVAPFVSGWRKGSAGPFPLRVDSSGTTAYVASGIGRDPGIIATEALVQEFRPDVLISAGFAGALVPERRVADEVSPGIVVDGTTGESFQTNAKSSGTIVSSGFIAHRSEKVELNQRFQAEAVDMEGASVAAVAKRHGIPFYAVKTISDELDFPMLPFAPFVDGKGSFQTGKFLVYVSSRPNTWLRVISMGRNSARAASELRSALQHLIRGIQQSRVASVS